MLRTLRYVDAQERVLTQPAASWQAIEHNDVLACCFARLNLWWLPGALPTRTEPLKGWNQYLKAWRPGEPHPETWPAFFEDAWNRVELAEETDS